ncbi:unnamed protein product [Miscanthus lutarioriparius]|uniref:BZIP domain-containing protein n=1 Tax=Miscanthus lutarioriparius TaxID=422564 RepID=A0A811PRE7_9POAL|nr:unnamed protein product [Miscanthus lutarioriparius]
MASHLLDTDAAGFKLLARRRSATSAASNDDGDGPSSSSVPAAAASAPAASARVAPALMPLQGWRATSKIRRVPEMGGASASASASSGAGADEHPKEDGKQGAQPPAAEKKRGRTAGDKEQNRLKRLLRNRVSAHQARERKKAYLTELEAKAKDLELSSPFTKTETEDAPAGQISGRAGHDSGRGGAR